MAVLVMINQRNANGDHGEGVADETWVHANDVIEEHASEARLRTELSTRMIQVQRAAGTDHVPKEGSGCKMEKVEGDGAGKAVGITQDWDLLYKITSIFVKQMRKGERDRKSMIHNLRIQ